MQLINRTLLIVGGINVAVLVITIVLFKYLNSQAMAEGKGAGLTGWKAGGALAGFLILMSSELAVIKFFTPKGVESHPSYTSVKAFYDSIQKKDYTNAWNLMSSQMQSNNWKGRIDTFVDGYKNTEAVKLRAIEFASKLSEFCDEYVVYYQDQTMSPVLPGFECLGDWHLLDSLRFSQRIADLRQQIVTNGLDPAVLDNMTLSQMITAIRGDILRWRIEKKCGKNSINKFFQSSKSVARLVGKRTLVNYDEKSGKWLITKISDIPYNEE